MNRSLVLLQVVVTWMVFLFCTPSQACTSCASIDGETYCVSGCIAELCQTSGDACLFSGSRVCCGSGCFLAGSQVLTATGLLAIADLKPGDVVLARTEQGKDTWVSVVHTYRSVAYDGYVRINGTLGVTADHPFRVDRRWVRAAELRVGDNLTTATGSKMLVVSIEHMNKGVRVYNIDTEDPGTFFAGNILVHNKDPEPGIPWKVVATAGP